MTRVSIKHKIDYSYSHKVLLSPHRFRLAPQRYTQAIIDGYSFVLRPANRLYWQHDVYGNKMARADFDAKTDFMSVEVTLEIELTSLNPFDVLVDDELQYFPFLYPSIVKNALLPYLQIVDRSSALTAFVGCTEKFHGETLSFLVKLNQHVSNHIRYVHRLESGVQSCEMTLRSRTGSCRDTAWLMVQALRRLGLASRFVSGYLIQLGTTSGDSVELHAWAEVFIPGASWIGLDTTSGLFTSEGHIPLAIGPGPEQVALVEGLTEPCSATMTYQFELTNH
ncbi:transglutaminase-like putative cysteine protease [Dyadobacter sp. BE34]|uniref:Transglutaminase-like putative cysteine protease n=1 Tax=Dyadobacter fermentans TaxID=94254 RepID=A0ABU1QSX6_9BACT|nr:MULTISPECIES: transglutaminase family protein [Dyadobacter]MDR6804173.1 transglutaminase-like putative cysteine protease [Dyadobacter fermentans]MDR7041913.1 transglutaminase-like putative cysteine protease [Dyadobacter sp. BE242]MDR7196316.1 transglutaminase-like putative cysteine protease [Dyadobacter sp. BE34]MDR7213139.1 transglutaminase-like putative cysteine protease [Dyadobacter sp. BE31]MDR7261722.1 transglutaminase-like putative cysteine protease [Dyadobacter sp. BE32]